MAKILYSDGFVLGEGKSLQNVYYAFYYDSYEKLSLSTISSLKKGHDMLVIKGNNLKNQKLSFAMESFVNEKRNSSESLKHMIDWATEGAILRELTGEEQEKLNQFKKKQTRKQFYFTESNLNLALTFLFAYEQ